MKDRTAHILDAAVETYIDTGIPVTSSLLYNRYDFGIKPAMIRWALNELCSQGYLYQQHSSSGRIPTNSAYERYAEELLGVMRSDADSCVLSVEQEELYYMLQEAVEERLVAELSSRLNMLSVVYDAHNDSFFEKGLSFLCDRLSQESRDSVLGVIHDFEQMKDRIGKESATWTEDQDWPKVFIGESPVTETDGVSVIIHRIVRSQGTFFVFVVGPKRMNYRQPLALFSRSLFSDAYKDARRRRVR